MNTLSCLASLLVATLAFSVSEKVAHPVETHFGSATIACNPSTSGTTGGLGTYFSNSQYSWERWNGKAKFCPIAS